MSQKGRFLNDFKRFEVFFDFRKIKTILYGYLDVDRGWWLLL